jgi:hypothetical protein
LAFGTTGKIVGTAVDLKTGDKIPSANVIIEGTNLGASSNVDGYFVIVNVSPGTYNVKISIMGFQSVTIRNVRVSIDQTTDLGDIKLTETAIATEEQIITAQRPIVQKDVSSSRANITIREVENLPTVSVSTVVGLQAGVSGMSVRGGSDDQTAFVVNGLTLRDERDNSPYTAISLLSVQEIQIQTGGFNAEYGNFRAGLVNVVTKEGSSVHYNVGGILRYSAPARKYFGTGPNEYNSYWIRPMLDPDVAWTGTADNTKTGYKSPWDPWKQDQYRPFEGWNSVSQKLMGDDDPTNDLSPQAAQQVWLWQHRKNFDITKPDYDVDFGISGPLIPDDINKDFGNLRFYASYRRTESTLMFPMTRDVASDWSGSLKITSDIAPDMKLMIEGLMGRNEAVDRALTGAYVSFTGDPSSFGAQLNRISYIEGRLFCTDFYGPNSVDRSSIGAKLTHVLNPTTFYEASVQRFTSQYHTGIGNIRNEARIYKFGNGYYLDEAPFGWSASPGDWSATGIDGLRMAIALSTARDTSWTASYTGKFDLSSQIDRYNLIKTGAEFTYTDNNVNYGSYDKVLQVGRSTSAWHTYPTRLALYVQDKLEFEGMIANLGVRMEMSYAGGQWYTYDLYSRALSGLNSYGLDTLLSKEPTKRVITFSPRLGVAFPISENAKLFFNYGHFRQMPAPENLYLIRHELSSGDVVRIADPNLPLPRTIQYELGYEHNLLDLFLLRVASYYIDVSDQSRLVNYVGINSVPNYSVTTNTSYADRRGFEVQLTKTRGDWINGLINYTYMVASSGNFGWGTQYQNPPQQRDYERTTSDRLQSKPIPAPYARVNLDFSTPVNFGPEVAGQFVLGDWRANIIGRWSNGSYFTWVGGGSYPGVQYNAQWRDNWSCDARISKSFQLGSGLNVQFFMDINNLFNIKTLTSYGFLNEGDDYGQYLKSLHLDGSYEVDASGTITRTGFNQYYSQIPGTDKAGDYREESVDYWPMLAYANRSEITTPNTRPIYYEMSTKTYLQWVNGAWQVADQSLVDRVLNDKAYINMPNQTYFNFLNPRKVYFGLRFSVDL